MRTQEVEGVIFDCDGTLLDTMGAWHNLEAMAAERADIHLTPEDMDILNANTPLQTARFFHEKFGLGESVADVQRLMYEELERYYANESQPRKGAVELVEELYRRNIPMTIVSSSPGSLLKLGLERAGIYDLFVEVISAADLGITKRGPLAVMHAQAVMHSESRGTWGFEDALYAAKVLKSRKFGAVGIYDSDIAGTYDQLDAVCDVAVHELTELDIDRFVAGAYRTR